MYRAVPLQHRIIHLKRLIVWRLRNPAIEQFSHSLALNVLLLGNNLILIFGCCNLKHGSFSLYDVCQIPAWESHYLNSCQPGLDLLREGRLGISFNQSKQNPTAHKQNLAPLMETWVLSPLIMADIKWTTRGSLSNIPTSYPEKPHQHQGFLMAVLGLDPTMISGGQGSHVWTLAPGEFVTKPKLWVH